MKSCSTFGGEAIGRRPIRWLWTPSQFVGYGEFMPKIKKMSNEKNVVVSILGIIYAYTNLRCQR